MSQTTGPYLVSPHVHPGFNQRVAAPSPQQLQPISSKRTANGMMPGPNPTNAPMGSNVVMGSSPSPMRAGPPMGPMKPGPVGLGPMDKANTMPYSSRYGRKAWSASRSANGKYKSTILIDDK